MDDVLDVLVVGAGPTGLASVEAIQVQRAGGGEGMPGQLVFQLSAGDDVFYHARAAGNQRHSIHQRQRQTHTGRGAGILRGVSEHYPVPIHYQERVENVAGSDGNFEVHAGTTDGDHKRYRTRKVIIATGYYDIPNLMGIPGEDLPKVSHFYGEAHAFYRDSGRDRWSQLSGHCGA